MTGQPGPGHGYIVLQSQVGEEVIYNLLIYNILIRVEAQTVRADIHCSVQGEASHSIHYHK